jgi:hypothetical protein
VIIREEREAKGMTRMVVLWILIPFLVLAALVWGLCLYVSDAIRRRWYWWSRGSRVPSRPPNQLYQAATERDDLACLEKALRHWKNEGGRN